VKFGASEDNEEPTPKPQMDPEYNGAVVEDNGPFVYTSMHISPTEKESGSIETMSGTEAS
jgi:hypothetical protein